MSKRVAVSYLFLLFGGVFTALSSPWLEYKLFGVIALTAGVVGLIQERKRARKQNGSFGEPLECARFEHAQEVVVSGYFYCVHCGFVMYDGTVELSFTDPVRRLVQKCAGKAVIQMAARVTHTRTYHYGSWN